MKWGLLLGVTAVIALMFWYEWPKMKQKPKKDKVAFVMLILIGWVLAMFDLPNMTGPTTWVDTIFEPFEKILEK